MRDWLSRCALLSGIGVLVAFVLAGGAGAAVRADLRADAPRTPQAGPYAVNLPAYMLGAADLPAGFRPYAPLTGPLDGARAKALVASAGQGMVSLIHAYVRDWVSPSTGWAVLELIVDEGTRSTATGSVPAFDSSMLAQRATPEQLTPDIEAFTVPFVLDRVSYVEITAAIARGPFLFRIAVEAPAVQAASANGVLAGLIAAQLSKVPANTPDTGTSLAALEPDTAGAAGYAIGALLGYLCIVNGYAYLRDPLRRGRPRRRRETPRQWPAGQRVLDVSGPARRYRNMAWARFAAQFAGLAVVAYGAVSYPDSAWYAFPLAGLAIVWASGRFIRPGRPLAPGNRHRRSGARRGRVTVYRVLASAAAIAGGLLIASYALNQETPPAVEAVAAATQAAGSPPVGPGPDYLWAGLILLAVGAIIVRRARRLAAVDARRLMSQDSRPPVVYLRAFRDDKLKLLAATLGRPSLIERFTPRRFDPFEEVIARHLTGTGPVIALNPPGTKLAPLGAARETLDSDGWQATISDWMAQAALIVLIVPPALVTDGLTWELDTISASQHWAKTLVLIPPVPAGALSDRWQAFRDAYGTRWPFSVPLTLDGPGPLALAFGDGVWTVLTAWRRHEWAYTAAIQGALGLARARALAGDDR